MTNTITIRSLTGVASKSAVVNESLVLPPNASLWICADYYTGSITNGTEIGVWNDRSGNNNNFSNSGAGTGPTHTTYAMPGGYSARLFNGRRIVSTNTVLSNSTASATFLVLKMNGADTKIIFEQGLSNYSYETSTGLNSRFYINNSGGALGQTPLTQSVMAAVSMVASGGFITMYKNGLSNTSSVSFTGNTGTGQLYMGGRSDGSLLTNAYIAEMIVYNRVLTSVELTRIWKYLDSKYLFQTLPADMTLHLDGNNKNSYIGSGTTWYDIGGYGNNNANMAAAGTITFTGSGGWSIPNSLVGANFGTFSTGVAQGKGNQTYMSWFRKHSNHEGSIFFEETADGGSGYTRLGMFTLLGGGVQFGGRGSSNEPTGNYRGKNTDGAVSNNAWHHMVGVWDVTNTLIRIYVDGVEVASTYAGGGTIDAHSNNLPFTTRIGASNGTWGFDGVVAKLTVYDRVLTPSEIRQVFQAQKSQYGL